MFTWFLIGLLIGGYMGIGLGIAIMAEELNKDQEDFVPEEGLHWLRFLLFIILAWPTLFRKI
jgi:hypothetical protein